jgi:predicted transcriptional regulator
MIHNAMTTPPLDIPLKKWLTRPPILEATRALGLNDQRVADLMELTQPAVAMWANGSRGIHPKRQLALIVLIHDLIEAVGETPVPDDPKMARRVAAVRQAAQAWVEVAAEEFKASIGGQPSIELGTTAMALRDLMWARLLERGMVTDD